MKVDENILKSLMGKILTIEKGFLNERQMTEARKIKGIKEIIEDEVKYNDN